MINFTENTKNQYKAYERQFSVYGNLYLAEKRLSNNLLNQDNYIAIYNATYNNGVVNQTNADSTGNIKIQFFDTLQYSTLVYEKYKTISLGVAEFIFEKQSNFNYLRFGVNGNNQDTVIIYDVSSLENGETYCFSANFTNITSGSISWKEMQIEKGNYTQYEEYGTIVNDYTLFPMTEENECKILGFNINEKTDIYYTSLPYNTMTIEVDNEKGYFTDYDVDSIVNKLNTDCYVDLFIKINEDDYYKIMTMKFDKISSSDYEKAKLSFKSSISIITNLPFRDKNKYFIQYSSWSMSTLLIYLFNNYGIKAKADVITNNAVNTINQSSKNVQSLILQAGTKYGNLNNAMFVINNYNDELVFKTWKSYAQDTILLDYQLEKSLIKRENTYNGVIYNYILNSSYATTTETYSRQINGTLTSKQDILIIRDNDYVINTITINDINISGNVTLELSVKNDNKNIIELIINGEIGTEYVITINKTNISKKTNDSYGEKSYGLVNDTSKILKVNETSPLNGDYYNLIFNDKTVRSYIEAKIIGLPYLEIGDTVEIETELAKILITISELNITFDGGLTETIKGYELGWDALFPSDTLYPSDDLYPNRPLD